MTAVAGPLGELADRAAPEATGEVAASIRWTNAETASAKRSRPATMETDEAKMAARRTV